MRRHIPRLLLIGALLSPSTPYALGLGDIRLNSALNQPFDAEIDLLSATAEELSSLQVGLANAETFTRYGLDRPAFLASFTFRVTRAADGRTVLRVVSSPSVTEPFVTLLVEASWSRGRLLRAASERRKAVRQQRCGRVEDSPIHPLSVDRSAGSGLPYPSTGQPEADGQRGRDCRNERAGGRELRGAVLRPSDRATG